MKGTPSLARVPLIRTWPGYPHPDLVGVPPPPSGPDWGTPPCGQTDGWMDGQTRVKILHSRRTTYAGGN